MSCTPAMLLNVYSQIFAYHAVNYLTVRGFRDDRVTYQDAWCRRLMHPGTSVPPCALAAAEETGASGQEFITALVAGYEVMERLAADFIPTLAARGFHASPVFGIFGGAAAAAKIFKANEEELNSAIALCASL